ncbi:MAG: Crp/Fnr family transcriptional regulator [Beijerinckiaceae bacterium]|nr:Crp/Fnr family transcriptional regulator [Beijerinckiaceae bacterium]
MLQSEFKNMLIRSIPAADFDLLRPHFEPIQLKLRNTTIQAGRSISHVYFPEKGQFSVIVKVPTSEPIEIGLFGVDGMTEMSPDFRASFTTVVQLDLEAHKIDAKLFADAVKASPGLTDLTVRYHQAMLAQLAYTAFSHGSLSVSERLARWLLMAHDRAEGDELPLAHDFFSWMLAVRRSGVTNALSELRSEGAIATKRARVIILNRDKLIERASGSYGLAEADYRRFLGMSLPRWDKDAQSSPLKDRKRPAKIKSVGM